MRTTPKWGVVMSDATHVLDKVVCFNEKNARRRGRYWKRLHPDHTVRVFSLAPRDTSEPVVIP